MVRTDDGQAAMRPLERFPFREAPADDIRQRLRDLPSERQPPYEWAEFRRRSRDQAWPKRAAVKWEHAAAAAGITVLVVSMAMWGRADRQHPEIAPSGVATAPLAANDATLGAEPRRAADDSAARGNPPVHEGAPTSDGSPAIVQSQADAESRARAQAMSLAAQAAISAQVAALAVSPASRQWLDRQPAEPAVMRVGPRLAVANLEDRIAWVDDALSDAQFAHADAAGMRALRQERTRLVGSLAQVRYAETLAAQLP
jgi:hypothetical protein